MINKFPIIGVIVPCFNEEEVIHETVKRLSIKINELITQEKVSDKSKIIFIDDGSNDNTWYLIEKYYIENPNLIKGIKLSINRGHQNALLCGLLSIISLPVINEDNSFDALISIDADLQDDINIIDNMIEKYISGYEIVYGVRNNRKSDSIFKRFTAQMFYKIMLVLGVKIVYNHADYRLMGRNSLEALKEYGEVNLFLRGIIPLLGFKSCIEYYTRNERFAGKSKYPIKKMLNFALEGITSFSIKPIRMITNIGVFIMAVSIGMIIYFFIRYFGGHTISGWASIACSIWGIGGLILFSIGVIGEYIGKIYMETKNRPRFHIEKYLK